MTLVVDTSVAVKWFVPEDGENIEAGTEAALELLSQHLIAPDCIFLVGAIQHGADLITADVKFYTNCLRTGWPYPIRLLGQI